MYSYTYDIYLCRYNKLKPSTIISKSKIKKEKRNEEKNAIKLLIYKTTLQEYTWDIKR